MTSIDMQMDGDNCWPDLKALGEKELVDIGELVGIALLPDAVVYDTLTGQERRVPAVTLRLRVGQRVVLAQLKVDMLETIIGGIRGRLAYLADLKRSAKGDS